MRSVRWWAPLLLCAACGRIGFDPFGVGPGGGDDIFTGSDGGIEDNDAMTVAGVEIDLSPIGECPALAFNGTGLGVVWRDGPNTGIVDLRGASLLRSRSAC